MPELETLLPLALPRYCERDVFGGEPLNSLSNLSFWVAALACWRAWRQRLGNFGAFALAMSFTVGVCSALWHWFRLPWLLPLDSLPLYVLVVGVGYRALSQLRGARYALATIALIFVGALVANALTAGTMLHVASRHGAALLGFTSALLPLRVRAPRAWAWLMCALGLYALALIGKTLDAPLCGVIPIGMHWLWHSAGGAAAGVAAHGAWLSSVEQRDP